MRDGTPDDDQRYAREVADTLAAGQGEGDIDCLINGWGPIQHVRVQARSLDDAPRFYGDPDEALLLGHIAACRDRKRALGFLKKSLEKLQTSPVTPLLVELVRLVREDWENCDAILATATEATNVSASENVPDEGFRLRATLVAILQATTERQMGGPINGPSGHA